MADVLVPKLNNNDTTYVLVEWLVEDETEVAVDDAVATVETSKASEELVCTEAGVLRHVVPAGSEYAPGTVIARVVPPGTPRAGAADTAGALDSGSTATAEVRSAITAPARAMMDELGISEAQVHALGLKVVRSSDIERLAASAADGTKTHKLPAGQRAVARNVTDSHSTIPAAYTAMLVDVGAALDLARATARQLRKLVGVPELLVAAVATLHKRFPLFFAHPSDEHTARLSGACHVGVTIDVGKGLYVPVVRNADQLSVGEIAAVTTGFRTSALRGSFREQDLADGTIAVTLHNDPDVTLAVPFIFPGQTCALALTGARTEVVAAAPGEFTTRTVTNIGLAYDHRFINGHDATLFLRAVKEALESPDCLAEGS
ncbi:MULTISPECIES: 2-oxo acid dehydrogenase subunit E2 [unclassified Streptomyces]|uniref:2-oxo acid dehydrogenase subunit E2 n=1 Tax=unclassified Streptomyces TaxID=2593676 RepID=UPI00324A4CF4